MLDCPANPDTIFLPQKSHDGVMPFTHSATELKEGQHGRNQDRKDQSANQREGDRPCHGLEQAPLDALQREDWQISGDDDGSGIEYGPKHFAHGVANALQGSLLGTRWQAEMPDDVFDDDDGSVDNHPEVECAQGEKICGNLVEVETD